MDMDGLRTDWLVNVYGNLIVTITWQINAKILVWEGVVVSDLITKNTEKNTEKNTWHDRVIGWHKSDQFEVESVPIFGSTIV